MIEFKLLDPIKDENILYSIVELEDVIFEGASIGNYNIKPMAKYGRVYALLNGEEIVSVIEVMSSFNRELAYIYGLFTNTKYQNQGMGHKILELVLKELKKIGIKKIQLTTGTGNVKANKLYLDFNFYIKELLKDEYKDGEERYLYEVLI
ncbi:GNAT family N-acetyltransferase [Streptobacillus felis]|uniref:GNAT family N-acetyltransferase n=1 Tax=Streptobacillus felis TaxID=1384509 RepID=A0A7Z0PDM7_9FUSO|nr:GNAT family N-acetyltransferase [Streptobacillus felis]NYV27281.1 GNAT family N-acetyltransferase [Streptobacillus felis]